MNITPFTYPADLGFSYPEGKTNYQIINEHGIKTTITLDKWVADVLQYALPDVHKSIQFTYDKSLKELPYLKRKQRGKHIHELFAITAEKHQEIKKKIVGWNEQDLLEALK